ncbi:hypothetical protein QAD02_003882 [Eretmocerus hayati]|uniref:Uncharacterized protein n=1 Tax=Eretmocerus hayati TaxID=131215 RepID=A0ACC2NN43_9HYME|nr:hypothetical protein QAD02_003882 [Eretmocerus hayati]
MVERLIENGATLNCVNDRNLGPLNEAILIEEDSERWAMIRFLISSGVNVKNDEHLKDSHMHDAVHCGDVELVKYLFDAGADLDRISSDGLGPIHLAVCLLNGKKRLQMIKQLIDIGSDVNIKNTGGFTCLHWVAKQNVDRIILTRMLFEAGAEINCNDKCGTTPLALAT